jgi:uncharacterized protein YqjF (DUF2071 family)
MIVVPAEQLLQFTKHRPFPLPADQWFVYQQWKDTLFLHCPIEPDLVKPLLPAGLTLDTITGIAWVSVVVFTITDLRMRLMSVFPLLPAFHELNLRTYVQRDNIPGIYFLQIKASSERAVLVNRLMTKLRYQYAAIRKTPSFHYHMTADKGSNLLDIDFHAGPFLNDVPSLDRWLTERYCCYQDDGPALYRYHIHHPVWPLYSVQPNYHLLRYNFRDLHLTDQTVHIMHYSPLQSTLIWRRERVV